VPTPLPAYSDDDMPDRCDWLREAGFQCTDDIDTIIGFLGMELFERADRGDFLIYLDLPCTSYPVYAPDMPSLLGLLGIVLPVIREATALSEMEERREKELERRRRGPNVYDHRSRTMRYARAGED
jgi:hypothetical protein